MPTSPQQLGFGFDTMLDEQESAHLPVIFTIICRRIFRIICRPSLVQPGVTISGRQIAQKKERHLPLKITIRNSQNALNAQIPNNISFAHFPK